MKKVAISMIVTTLVLLLSIPAIAGNKTQVQKDPNNWSIIKGGASGTLHYDDFGSTFDFSFSAKKLQPCESYTLIYYPDPWPGTGLIPLASGRSTRKGEISLSGSLNTGDLPAWYDYNNPANPNHAACQATSTCIENAKIWLVLSNDLSLGEENEMVDWNPTKYLFEKGPDTGIIFNDKDEGNLFLYEKEPVGDPYPIVVGGAWGILRYNEFGPAFKYNFQGSGLLASTGYSLIYYADPWPGNGVTNSVPQTLISSGTSDASGGIQLLGSINLNMDLPHPSDKNFPTGAKIWLVLSSDYDGTNAMHGWNPTGWLFEGSLIKYNDTDVP